MNNLPKINRNFLNLVSEEMQEEITRQTRHDPWGHVALKVGAYLAALFIVIGVAHLISKWGMF